VKVWTPEKKRLCDPQRGFDLDSPQTPQPADRREPWERTATESSKAFEAFKISKSIVILKKNVHKSGGTSKLCGVERDKVDAAPPLERSRARL
jgi:hypothetical protein